MNHWERQLNFIIRWAMTLTLLCGPQLTAARAHSPTTTFIVTKTADTNDGACDADCSLREAILAANAQPGADSVIVPAGIYTLTIPGIDEDAGATGDLDITDDLTLTGAGAETTVVDGGGIDRVMQVTGTVTLDGISVTRGQSFSGGPAGIQNNGILTLANSIVISNTGIGIDNLLGVMTVLSSTISNNTLNGMRNKGGNLTVIGTTISDNLWSGILTERYCDVSECISSQLTVINSVFSNNAGGSNQGLYGGGIFIDQVTAQIRDSVFLNNHAASGGGIYIYSPTGLPADLLAHVQIVNSVFISNTASNMGGGLFNGGILTITNSLFSNNDASLYGGGIHNYSPPNGYLNIYNSTFSNNVSEFAGGGIYNYWRMSVFNSTFNSNSTTLGGGGAILNFWWMTATNITLVNNLAGHGGGGIAVNSYSTSILTNATVVNNTADSDNNGSGDGGGLYAYTDTVAALVNLSNVLLAGNTDLGGEAPDCGGTLTSLGYTLIQNPTGCVISGTLTGVITGTDPLLGPLQDNGGPTLTHAPLPGSPVIDAGNPATPGSGSGACEVLDQRSYLRPVDGDGNGSAVCDIGAVEVGSAPGVAFTTNAVTVNEAEALATLTVTLSSTRTETITVDYATSDGTALAGNDYITTTGTLTFAPGSTLMTFTVPLVEDMLDELDESFTVTLSNPVNAYLVGLSASTLTIVDNDIEHRLYLPVLRR